MNHCHLFEEAKKFNFLFVLSHPPFANVNLVTNSVKFKFSFKEKSKKSKYLTDLNDFKQILIN